ncbi:MAG: 50S ribosomal protein L1 [Candidatus Kariarchaeaceae archaeon]|jgi:large subunit ribosomal protein L1
MSVEVITEAVRKAKSSAKKRKFNQSIDIAVALRDVNLKDPSKRFRVEVLLPHVISPDIKLCVIGDAMIISRAKEHGIEYTLDENEVESLAKDSKQAKEFITSIDYFLAIPQLMAVVGKNLGRYLGPSGKMPTILPPNANLEDFIARYTRTCKINLKQNPVIHCRVGDESMADNELASNIRTVLNEIENRLDSGANNIKHTHIKTTMGPTVVLGAK